MKLKNIILVIAMLIIIIFLSLFFNSLNKTDEVKVSSEMSGTSRVKKSEIKHEIKIEARVQPKPTEPKTSLQALIGPIHNQYGIRDDILDYIEKTIPHWNKTAWNAAIKIAQEQQFLYYSAKNDEEAFLSSNRTMFAFKCLGKEFPDANKDYDIFENIENLMMNTRNRKLHIWEVNSKFFAGKFYERKTPTKEALLEKCVSGAY